MTCWSLRTYHKIKPFIEYVVVSPYITKISGELRNFLSGIGWNFLQNIQMVVNKTTGMSLFNIVQSQIFLDLTKELLTVGNSPY